MVPLPLVFPDAPAQLLTAAVRAWPRSAVVAPVRWIFRQSPATGRVQDIYDDPRMVRFEGGVVFLACVSAVLTVAALAVDPPPSLSVGLWVTAGTSAVAWAGALRFGWNGRLTHTPRAFGRTLSVGKGNSLPRRAVDGGRYPAVGG